MFVNYLASGQAFFRSRFPSTLLNFLKISKLIESCLSQSFITSNGHKGRFTGSAERLCNEARGHGIYDERTKDTSVAFFSPSPFPHLRY